MHESIRDIFQATMSENRFRFISRFIRFDDPDTRAERWKSDKFACMRSILETFNANCSKYRYPSGYLAVDETLYPYRVRISFKQYNPNKPAKYGLLDRSICDALIPYTHHSSICWEAY